MALRTKIMSWGAVVATVASLVMAPSAMAWGPERETYTMAHPATSATFNSITDNAAVGDERDFVRIVEKGTENEYVSKLEIEPGKQYVVYIYYHNDASKTFNDKAHNYAGVAREARVASDFPKELAAGQEGKIYAEISASNTTPEVVWDEAYVTAKQAMKLYYIEGSAKIWNDWNRNGTIMSTRLFDKEGTYLGLAELNGVILGCDEYSGSVTYTLQTVAVEQPNPDPDPNSDPNPDPDPDPEPKPDPEPNVPSELPKTGPIEIILAVVVVGAIVAGVLYWNKTHKEVKKATKRAKGKK